MKILHIAIHLGGGVGTVLRNWIKKDTNNEHNILLLNKNFYGEKCPNIHEEMRGKYNEIYGWIDKSDIVIIHYWNHPYIFEFLISSKLPKCRLCFWSHISGLNPPYIHSEKLINFSDKFIFSSKVSHDNCEPNIKIDTIWTTGGLDNYKPIEKSNDRFTIGYIGTLDYAKLHPSFVNLCEHIIERIPDVLFTICGSGCDEEKIKNEIESKSISSNFNFMGRINNVSEVIPTFNVFGYPLNRKHFGTCEQVLGEVMACGIEPIVFNNPSEKFIVEGYGRICETEKDYISNILDLYQHPTTKNKVKVLIKRANELYDINTMINSWNNIFDLLILKEKNERSWNIHNNPIEGHKIFIESLGKYGEILYGSEKEILELFDSNEQWHSLSKGSVIQYLEAFPDDCKLKEWYDILKRNNHKEAVK
jgi:glycosyltransferase involved in cell wall biosynthesis